MVRLEGFEPPTPWFEAKYSIQLSYRRVLGEQGVLCKKTQTIRNWNNKKQNAMGAVSIAPIFCSAKNLG
jgi:hypothetical protein